MKWEPWQIAYRRWVDQLPDVMMDEQVMRLRMPERYDGMSTNLFSEGYLAATKGEEVKKYDPKAERLAFRDSAVLDSGRIYMTVRAGDKWLRNYLNEKQDIVLLSGDGKPVASAYIVRVCYLPLSEIPHSWLLVNHDTNQHTLAGVLAHMREMYPVSDIKHDDSVSVVFYLVD